MSNVKLNIKVKNNSIPSYYHNGDYYVEGREGSEYTLEIVNNTYKRIMAIPSVDGLSIFDGKPATKESNGYIVDALSKIEVPGWTIDNSNVAKFVFSSVDNSYSTYQSGGNTSNNGVIGVKIYEELTSPITSAVFRGADMFFGNNIQLCASSSQGYSNSVGTGFGEKSEFNVTEVSFNKGRHLEDIILYYDSLQGLKKRGIKIEPLVFNKPVAFIETGCVPPNNWKG